MPARTAKILIFSAVLIFQAGCASTQTVPMKVQSDPLGAYVLMKVRGEENTETDWIFLGSTPITTQRRFDKDQFGKDRVLVLRLLKDGYVEQTKEWQVDELRSIRKEDGHLFWNPKLVGTN